MLATVPVKVRFGKAVSVKFAFWPGWILPMSASLIDALTCGALRSLRVMNALPVLRLVSWWSTSARRAGRPAADPLADRAVQAGHRTARRRDERRRLQVVLRCLSARPARWRPAHWPCRGPAGSAPPGSAPRWLLASAARPGSGRPCSARSAASRSAERSCSAALACDLSSAAARLVDARSGRSGTSPAAWSGRWLRYPARSARC